MNMESVEQQCEIHGIPLQHGQCVLCNQEEDRADARANVGGGGVLKEDVPRENTKKRDKGLMPYVVAESIVRTRKLRGMPVTEKQLHTAQAVVAGKPPKSPNRPPHRPH